MNQSVEGKRLLLGKIIGHTAKTYLKGMSYCLKRDSLPINAELGVLLFWIRNKEGQTQNELVGVLHKDKSGITRAVDQLEDLGYVVRIENSKDKRVKLLYLTKSGKKILHTLEKIWFELEEKATAGLTVEEKETVNRAMIKIMENLEKTFL